MKKKNLVIKTKAQRDKTPDIPPSKKNLTEKLLKNSITPSGSSKNIIKKKKVLNKNPIDTNPLKTSINKGSIEFNKLHQKNENKKEYTKINPKSISNTKSSVKSSLKNRKEENNKEKEKEVKRNLNNKKINNNKLDALNKTTELFYKPNINRTNKIKVNNNINDTQRRKSFDIAMDKIKDKKALNIKKRNLKINTEKSIDNIKKDTSILKTEREKKNTLKFSNNRDTKKIMNKTPDAGRLRHHKNVKTCILKNNNFNEISLKKEKKFGKIDIKSIKKTSIKESTTCNNNEKADNNKIEVLKDIIYRKKRIKKYNSNNVECLYLSLNSGFFNPNKKLNLFLKSRELFNNLNNKNMIKELIEYYYKKGLENPNYNNKDKNLEKINIVFNPCERSINALNFIDKNEEMKLINEVQHPYINELFKMVLILLNEYNKNDKNIYDFLFNDILSKYKVKNIKNLMLNIFVGERIIISDEQFELIQKILTNKPDLLSPSTLLKYNRAVAYFSFFLKDLFSYLNLKTEDGIYFFKIRASLPKNKYIEQIHKLKLLL
jgi:hypothetical protein